MLDGYEGEEIKLGLVKCNCIYNSVIIFIMEDGVKRSLKVKLRRRNLRNLLHYRDLFLSLIASVAYRLPQELQPGGVLKIREIIGACKACFKGTRGAFSRCITHVGGALLFKAPIGIPIEKGILSLLTTKNINKR
jgi:hypothetical protein